MSRVIAQFKKWFTKKDKQKALEDRLAQFDPKRHGGEVMTITKTSSVWHDTDDQ